MKIKVDSIKSKLKKVPGTIMYTGNSDLKTAITHYQYSKDQFRIIDDLYNYSSEFKDWIRIDGFQDQPTITEFSRKIGVGTFFIEDIFNVAQRNKFNVAEDHLFVVLKYALMEEELSFRYISFIVKKNLIVTYSDYENLYAQNLLERIEENNALFNAHNENYLLYAMYDMIIDEQIDITKRLNIQLNEYELVILDSKKGIGNDLFKLHKNLVLLRNNAKSMVENLSPSDLLKTDLFSEEMDRYMNDLDDHIMNLIEKLNFNIEICNSLISMYSNQISNKTNEVMKILTVISVIFIPLSFFAGVFGMNFIHFDILKYENGVLLFFILSIAIVATMLVLFRRNKWL